MNNERPRGHYQGPLSFEWSSYSNTLRATPMNYLAADLSRLDAALWGREDEIGSLLAAAPAMRNAMRDVLACCDANQSPADAIEAMRALLNTLEA